MQYATSDPAAPRQHPDTQLEVHAIGGGGSIRCLTLGDPGMRQTLFRNSG